MVYQTENYVLSEEKLGRGATGDVFKCYNKNSGEAFAAKVFPSHDTRSGESKRREIDILKKLDHPNIVKFYGLEYLRLDHGFIQNVIITELCLTDMYAVIETPENANGLEEEVLKDVVTQVCRGLCYLYYQDPPIVHRDLKPGNILRSRKHEGGFLYKICDFGGAREMPESGEFFSIYGTPEYLAPAVFKNALIKQTNRDAFSSKIDLWSLGGTLYHLATGTIPFKPVRNPREDKETMYNMIKQKPTGSISCSQDGFGRLQYSHELPHTVNLSKSFRNLLTPILQGLLEDKNGISHDECFNAVEMIGKMKIVNVFVTKQCLLTKLYVKPGESLPLAAILKSNLGIDIENTSNNDDCYFGMKLVSECNENIYDLKTTPLNPIIVVSNSMDSSDLLEVFVSSTAAEKLKVKVKNCQDYLVAKEYCVGAFQYLRSAKKYLQLSSLIEVSKNNIQSKTMLLLDNYRKACNDLLSECKTRVDAVKHNEGILNKFNKVFGETKPREAEDEDSKNMNKILQAISELNENIETTLPKNLLNEFWKNLTINIPTEKMTVWRDIIQEEFSTIREIFYRFCRDGQHVSAYIDLVHASDKKRIRQGFDNIVKCHDNILDQRNKLHDALADWITCSNNLSSRIDTLHRELHDFKLRLHDQYNQEMLKFEVKIFDPIETLKTQLESMCQVAPDLVKIVKHHQNSMESFSLQSFGNSDTT